MRTTPSISQPESLVLRPHKMQFVIDELPSLAVCCAGGIYGGMEGVPYPVAGVAVFFFLSLVLLYRFIYLCRIHTTSASSSLSVNRVCSSERWTIWNCTVSWTSRNIRA